MPFWRNNFLTNEEKEMPAISYPLLDGMANVHITPLLSSLQSLQPLGGIFEEAINWVLNWVIEFAFWIGIAILVLVVGYTFLQTVTQRATNGLLDALVRGLRNPFVLGIIVGIVTVSGFFLFRNPNVRLVEGDHVVCEQNDKRVYRYTKGTLRHYPDPIIARSWGSVWISATDNNHKMISKEQCDKLPKGPTMPMNLVDGDHVACQDNPGAIYRFTGGQLRLYTDPTIARSWGHEWISATNNNHKLLPKQHCMSLVVGPPMPMNLVEGDHVACQPNTGAIYRFTEGQLRPYPNPKIANSWGSVWISARNNNHKVITRTACDAIPRGPPMDMK